MLRAALNKITLQMTPVSGQPTTRGRASSSGSRITGRPRNLHYGRAFLELFTPRTLTSESNHNQSQIAISRHSPPRT